MGRHDIECSVDKEKLYKNNKQRCVDNTVTSRKWTVLKNLVKTYNEEIRPAASPTNLKCFDEKIRTTINNSADILKNRRVSAPPSEELQPGSTVANIIDSTFTSPSNSTELALQTESFTRRRSLGRTLSISSTTSEEDLLQVTIVSAPDKEELQSLQRKGLQKPTPL
ncbi:hypothetical protein ABEB36_013542 [Hypothenemus hampei]|uniref:Uncharacterized protein n=1 Tax=Hypothenemus hampei TaxID=57062 RepID=A0ABD1E4H8_HYPHA